MKTVLLTTDQNPFGGVLATAYQQSDGPPIDTVIVLPERGDLGFPWWSKPYVALKVVGVGGIWRLLAGRFGARLLGRRQREIGATAGWVDTWSAGGAKVLRLESINDDHAVSLLGEMRPDVLVSIGVPCIVKARVLAIPSRGAINVHNGRLPDYRGLFATFWEVLNREPWAYVSVHEMAPEVDAGRVLAVDRVDVARAQSFLDLLIEKKHLGGCRLAEVLRAVESGGRPAELPCDFPRLGERDDYYGWPTVRDVVRFSWRMRNRSARPATQS